MNPDVQDEINLERVVCLLSGSDCSAWIAYLRDKGLNDEEPAAVRVRALKALRCSLPEEEVDALLGRSSFELDNLISLLAFISRLEFLGFFFKVRSVNSVHF